MNRRHTGLVLAAAALTFAVAWAQQVEAEPVGEAAGIERTTTDDVDVDDWIDILVERLRDAESIRQSASAALAALGEPATRRLEELERGDDPAMAQAARELLATMPGGTPPREGSARTTSGTLDLRARAVTAGLDLEEADQARLEDGFREFAARREELLRQARERRITTEQFSRQQQDVRAEFEKELAEFLDEEQVGAVLRKALRALPPPTG